MAVTNLRTLIMMPHIQSVAGANRVAKADQTTSDVIQYVAVYDSVNENFVDLATMVGGQDTAWRLRRTDDGSNAIVALRENANDISLEVMTNFQGALIPVSSNMNHQGSPIDIATFSTFMKRLSVAADQTLPVGGATYTLEFYDPAETEWFAANPNDLGFGTANLTPSSYTFTDVQPAVRVVTYHSTTSEYTEPISTSAFRLKYDPSDGRYDLVGPETAARIYYNNPYAGDSKKGVQFHFALEGAHGIGVSIRFFEGSSGIVNGEHFQQFTRTNVQAADVEALIAAQGAGTLTLRAYVADSVLGLQGFDFREGRAVPIVMDSTDTVGYTNGSTTNLTILAFQLKTKILANPSTPHTLNNGTILRAASSGDVSLGPIVTELYNGFSATHASSLRLVSAADDESQGEIVEYVDPTVGYRITSANLANISSKKYKLQYPVTVNGTQYWEDVFLDTISSDGADVYGAASSNVAHFLILKYQYTITAAEQSTVTSYTQVTNGVRYRLAKITVDMPTDAEEAVIAAGDLDAQIDFKNISYLVRTDDNVSFNLGEQITHDRLPYSEGTSLEYMMYLLPQSGSTPIDLGTYQLNVFDPQSGTFEPLTKTSDSSVMEWLFYRGVQVSLSNIAPRSYNISSQLNMPWSLSTTSLYAVYNYDATEYIDDAQTITGWKLADLEITAGPNAMIDLVEPDTQPNLLRMTSAPNSSGKYTMYIDEEFAPQAHREVSTATLVITDTNGVPVTFNFKYMFLRPPKVLSIVDTWEPSSRVNDNGELIDTLSAADLVPLNGFTNERKVMELYLESYDATDAGLTLRPLGTVGWASPSGSFEAYSYARLNLDTTSEYIVDGVPTRRLEVYVTMVDGFLPSQPTIVQLTTQMLNNSFTWVDGKYLSGSGQIPFDTFSIFAAAPEAGQVVVGTSATVVSGTIDYATRTGTATLSEIPNDMEVGDALLLGPTNNGNFGTITAIDSVNKIVSFEGLRRSILTPSDIAELEALQVKTMFFPSTVLEGTALKGPTGITITDQEQDESLVKTGTPHLYVYSSDDLLVDADGDVEEEPDAYLIATIEFPDANELNGQPGVYFDSVALSTTDTSPLAATALNVDVKVVGNQVSLYIPGNTIATNRGDDTEFAEYELILVDGLNLTFTKTFRVSFYTPPTVTTSLYGQAFEFYDSEGTRFVNPQGFDTFLQFVIAMADTTKSGVSQALYDTSIVGDGTFTLSDNSSGTQGSQTFRLSKSSWTAKTRIPLLLTQALKVTETWGNVVRTFTPYTDTDITVWRFLTNNTLHEGASIVSANLLPATITDESENDWTAKAYYSFSVGDTLNNYLQRVGGVYVAADPVYDSGNDQWEITLQSATLSSIQVGDTVFGPYYKRVIGTIVSVDDTNDKIVISAREDISWLKGLPSVQKHTNLLSVFYEDPVTISTVTAVSGNDYDIEISLGVIRSQSSTIFRDGIAVATVLNATSSTVNRVRMLPITMFQESQLERPLMAKLEIPSTIGTGWYNVDVFVRKNDTFDEVDGGESWAVVPGLYAETGGFIHVPISASTLVLGTSPTTIGQYASVDNGVGHYHLMFRVRDSVYSDAAATTPMYNALMSQGSTPVYVFEDLTPVPAPVTDHVNVLEAANNDVLAHSTKLFVGGAGFTADDFDITMDGSSITSVFNVTGGTYTISGSSGGTYTIGYDGAPILKVDDTTDTVYVPQSATLTEPLKLTLSSWSVTSVDAVTEDLSTRTIALYKKPAIGVGFTSIGVAPLSPGDGSSIKDLTGWTYTGFHPDISVDSYYRPAVTAVVWQENVDAQVVDGNGTVCISATFIDNDGDATIQLTFTEGFTAAVQGDGDFRLRLTIGAGPDNAWPATSTVYNLKLSPTSSQPYDFTISRVTNTSTILTNVVNRFDKKFINYLPVSVDTDQSYTLTAMADPDSDYATLSVTRPLADSDATALNDTIAVLIDGTGRVLNSNHTLNLVSIPGASFTAQYEDQSVDIDVANVFGQNQGYWLTTQQIYAQVQALSELEVLPWTTSSIYNAGDTGVAMSVDLGAGASSVAANDRLFVASAAGEVFGFFRVTADPVGSVVSLVSSLGTTLTIPPTWTSTDGSGNSGSGIWYKLSHEDELYEHGEWEGGSDLLALDKLAKLSFSAQAVQNNIKMCVRRAADFYANEAFGEGDEYADTSAALDAGAGLEISIGGVTLVLAGAATEATGATNPDHKAFTIASGDMSGIAAGDLVKSAVPLPTVGDNLFIDGFGLTPLSIASISTSNFSTTVTFSGTPDLSGVNNGDNVENDAGGLIGTVTAVDDGADSVTFDVALRDIGRVVTVDSGSSALEVQLNRPSGAKIYAVERDDVVVYPVMPTNSTVVSVGLAGSFTVDSITFSNLIGTINVVTPADLSGVSVDETLSLPDGSVFGIVTAVNDTEDTITFKLPTTGTYNFEFDTQGLYSVYMVLDERDMTRDLEDFKFYLKAAADTAITEVFYDDGAVLQSRTLRGRLTTNIKDFALLKDTAQSFPDALALHIPFSSLTMEAGVTSTPSAVDIALAVQIAPSSGPMPAPVIVAILENVTLVNNTDIGFKYLAERIYNTLSDYAELSSAAYSLTSKVPITWRIGLRNHLTGAGRDITTPSPHNFVFHAFRPRRTFTTNMPLVTGTTRIMSPDSQSYSDAVYVLRPKVFSLTDVQVDTGAGGGPRAIVNGEVITSSPFTATTYVYSDLTEIAAAIV